MFSYTFQGMLHFFLRLVIIEGILLFFSGLLQRLHGKMLMLACVFWEGNFISILKLFYFLMLVLSNILDGKSEGV